MMMLSCTTVGLVGERSERVAITQRQKGEGEKKKYHSVHIHISLIHFCSLLLCCNVLPIKIVFLVGPYGPLGTPRAEHVTVCDAIRIHIVADETWSAQCARAS